MQRTCFVSRRISADLRWGWLKFPWRLSERGRKVLMNKLPRSWVAIERSAKRTSITSSRPQPGFKVLQWNVLADGLAQNGNFTNVSPFQKPSILTFLWKSRYLLKYSSGIADGLWSSLRSRKLMLMWFAYKKWTNMMISSDLLWRKQGMNLITYQN